MKNHGGLIAYKVGNLRKKRNAENLLVARRNDPPAGTADGPHHDELVIEAYEWLLLNTSPWTTVIDYFFLIMS
jgi:hypothetical protein